MKYEIKPYQGFESPRVKAIKIINRVSQVNSSSFFSPKNFKDLKIDFTSAQICQIFEKKTSKKTNFTKFELSTIFLRPNSLDFP